MDIKGRLLDVVFDLTEMGTDEARIKGDARVAVMTELYDMDEAELRSSIEDSFGVKADAIGLDDLRLEAHRLVIEHLKTIYTGRG